MKKLFLLIAFAGMVSAVSATTLTSLAKDGITSVKQDDKQKKDTTNHNCSKQEKGKCCKGKKDGASHHDCSKHEKGKCDMHHKDSTKTH